MISFDCQCGKPFRFSLKFRGREFRCNMCGRPLVVPQESIISDQKEGGTKQFSSIGTGEVIAPVKPVLQIDVEALSKTMQGAQRQTAQSALSVLPKSSNRRQSTQMNRQPQPLSEKTKFGEEVSQKTSKVSQRPAPFVSDDDDDDIVISGDLSKIDEDHFHIDIEIEPIEGEPVVVDVIPETASIETSPGGPPKKKGFFGFGAKKAKTSQKPPAEKLPAPKKVMESAESQPQSVSEAASKKKGFFGFGTKKTKTAQEPPAQKQPVVEPVVPAPAVKETPSKKGKPTKPEKIAKPQKAPQLETATGAKKKGGLTTILMIIYPLLIVAFAAMWYLEKGKTNAEIKNVKALQTQVETLRREISDLQKGQASPTTEPQSESTELPSTNTNESSPEQAPTSEDDWDGFSETPTTQGSATINYFSPSTENERR